VQTYIQDPTMTVPLVRCSALPMFEGHPLIVTAQLEASQVELTSYINATVPSSISLASTSASLPIPSNPPASSLRSLNIPDN
jgi:hypothetical protein